MIIRLPFGDVLFRHDEGSGQLYRVTEALEPGDMGIAGGEAFVEGAFVVGGDDDEKHMRISPWACWRRRRSGRMRREALL